MFAGRNSANVPDDRTLVIETGRTDHQYAAFLVSRREIRKHLRIHVTCNETVKWPRIGERLPEYHAVESVQGAQCPYLILALYGRVELTQLLNVRPTQKRERCYQPAGADACHKFELRHGAAVEPAANQSGTDVPIATAAGHRHKMCGRQGVTRRPACGPFALQRVLPFTDQSLTLQVIPGPEAGIWKPEHRDSIRDGGRYCGVVKAAWSRA